MKKSKKVVIPEVAIWQHKKLIKACLDSEYIYLYDGRFRYAVTHDIYTDSYDILVCSLSGDWYTIDTVSKSGVDSAVWACLNAVITSYTDGTFESDLDIIGIKRC